MLCYCYYFCFGLKFEMIHLWKISDYVVSLARSTLSLLVFWPVFAPNEMRVNEYRSWFQIDSSQNWTSVPRTTSPKPRHQPSKCEINHAAVMKGEEANWDISLLLKPPEAYLEGMNIRWSHHYLMVVERACTADGTTALVRCRKLRYSRSYSR